MQFGSLVVKRRRGWRERGEGARKRDVCYILSNLSSWCWGLIAAAKDKWIISCCFHLYTIYCQIAQSQNEGLDFWLFFFYYYYYLRVIQVSICEKINIRKNSKGAFVKKNVIFLFSQMKQTETHVVNVFVCSTEIANICFAQKLTLLFFLHSFKSLIRT